MFVLWKVIASLIVVVALTIGFIDILINVESNGCEMTYMYENPQYHVSKNVIALLFFFIPSVFPSRNACFLRY